MKRDCITCIITKTCANFVFITYWHETRTNLYNLGWFSWHKLHVIYEFNSYVNEILNERLSGLLIGYVNTKFSFIVTLLLKCKRFLDTEVIIKVIVIV